MLGIHSELQNMITIINLYGVGQGLIILLKNIKHKKMREMLVLLKAIDLQGKNILNQDFLA